MDLTSEQQRILGINTDSSEKILSRIISEMSFRGGTKKATGK
jgi:hypothetical protein